MSRKNNEPLYYTVYKKMKREIIDGVYAYGDKLPSKRVVADTFGVSVITAEHVYDLLLGEGYAEARQRSGYYCIFKKSDMFYPSDGESAEPTDNAVPTAEKNSFPFNLYAKTARKVLSFYGERIFTRCDGTGSNILKSELAAYLVRSRGMTVSPEQIIIGSGSEYLYGVIIDVLGKNRIYAAENPSYERIEQVYKSKGLRYEMLPLGKDGIKSEALEKTAASVLHISPYRSYPSGVTASASKRLEYVNWLNGGERCIVEDDFESEFTVTGKIYDTVFSAAEGKNVIYMNTFSQTVSSAVRVAYLVLPRSLAGAFRTRLKDFSCTVPTFEQYILASMLKSGEFERHINRTRRRIRREMQNEQSKS